MNKRYMKPFIGMLFWSILLICSACTDENETVNGVRTDGHDGVPLTIRTIVTDFDNFSGLERSSTRATVKDKHLKTEFVDGDAIGIFAIKNNAIIDNVENTQLIYNASSGSWGPAENGEMLYWYEGVSYIAYYPYKKDITIDATKDTKEIIASLVGNAKLQPATDQSTMEKHCDSDLMTAVGTPEVGSSSQIFLNLQFQHQFTLLVLHPQAYVGCYAPKDAGFVYHKESRILGTDSATLNVKLNGITAYQIDSMKYCAIVPPQASPNIAGNYMTINGRDNTQTKISYSGSTTTFASGKCYTLKVISPVPGKGSTERKLYPGDFVFQNVDQKRIEIHPGDGLLEADGKIWDYKNAIGMVITCDPKKMTDKECNAKGWNHAYVVGLANLGPGRWGKLDTLEPDMISMTKHDSVENNMNGYSETEQMLKNCSGDTSNEYKAFQLINNYRITSSVPEGLNRSPWFIPSIGQWFDMLVNICGKSPRDFRDGTQYGLNDVGWGEETLNILINQLNKVGNSLPEFSSDHRLSFSCSTQYDKDRNWMLIWHMNDPTPQYKNWKRVCLQGFEKSSHWNIRPFFAF